MAASLFRSCVKTCCSFWTLIIGNCAVDSSRGLCPWYVWYSNCHHGRMTAIRCHEAHSRREYNQTPCISTGRPDYHCLMAQYVNETTNTTRDSFQTSDVINHDIDSFVSWTAQSCTSTVVRFVLSSFSQLFHS